VSFFFWFDCRMSFELHLLFPHRLCPRTCCMECKYLHCVYTCTYVYACICINKCIYAHELALARCLSATQAHTSSPAAILPLHRALPHGESSVTTGTPFSICSVRPTPTLSATGPVGNWVGAGLTGDTELCVREREQERVCV